MTLDIPWFRDLTNFGIRRTNGEDECAEGSPGTSPQAPLAALFTPPFELNAPASALRE